MKHEQKIPFMAKVKDKVTGLTGTVTAFLVYMTGCVQYEIKYLNKAGDDICCVWIDEERIEVVSEESNPVKPTKGGPSRGPHHVHSPSSH